MLSTITAIIIILQLCTYIFGDGPTDYETAWKWGAIQDGRKNVEDWVRLHTYGFVQIGGMYHIVMNVMALIFLGPYLARIYGPLMFSFLYYLSGIGGGFFILAFSDNVIAVGASGSIFGLMGVCLALLLKRYPYFDHGIRNWIVSGLVMNLIITFSVLGISIAGHLGGLVGGLILGFLVSPHEEYRMSGYSKSVLQTISIPVLLFIVLSFPGAYADTEIIQKAEVQLSNLVNSCIAEKVNNTVSSSQEKIVSTFNGTSSQEPIVTEKTTERIDGELTLNPNYTYHYQWHGAGVASDHYMVYEYSRAGFDFWTLSDESPYEYDYFYYEDGSVLGWGIEDQYLFTMPLPVGIGMKWSHSSETEGDASYEVTGIYKHYQTNYYEFDNVVEIKSSNGEVFYSTEGFGKILKTDFNGNILEELVLLE